MEQLLAGFTQFFFSFTTTVAFAVICNVSRKVLVQCGICGALGWLCYWILHTCGFSMVLATLAGSIVVAIISARLSVFCKMPVTVFNIPGIVPLVPGALAYESIRFLALGDYEQFLRVGVDTFMVAGAIALGLILAEVFNANIRTFTKRFGRMTE